MLSACDRPSTYAIRRSWLSRSISTSVAIVGSNSARAAAVASGAPTSTKITWRPLSSSVSGPNIGCTEHTSPPAARSACEAVAQRRLERADVEHDALRRRGGHLGEDLRRSPASAPRSRSARDRASPCASRGGRDVRRARRRGSAISTAKPCAREVAHEPAAHVAARRRSRARAGPRPRPLAATVSFSCTVSEPRISARIELLAERRRQAVLDRRRARALDDVALLAVVARRDAGVALDLADLLRDAPGAARRARGSRDRSGRARVRQGVESSARVVGTCARTYQPANRIDAVRAAERPGSASAAGSGRLRAQRSRCDRRGPAPATRSIASPSSRQRSRRLARIAGQIRRGRRHLAAEPRVEVARE